MAGLWPTIPVLLVAPHARKFVGRNKRSALRRAGLSAATPSPPPPVESCAINPVGHGLRARAWPHSLVRRNARAEDAGNVSAAVALASELQERTAQCASLIAPYGLLPPALVRHLESLGHEATHVADLGMQAAHDRDIWNQAFAMKAVLVSKDEDFVTMRALRSQGPAVVWVRVGNATRRMLIARFAAALPGVLAALERGETIVQIADV